MKSKTFMIKTLIKIQFFKFIFLMLIPFFISACGYATGSLLPVDIRTVYVSPTENKIDITEEITEDTAYRKYKPFLEADITEALENRFMFDGELKVIKDEASADLVLETELVNYTKDPLRYADNDDVQEYRLTISVRARLYRKGEDKPIWERETAGEADYFTSGTYVASEDSAVTEALNDVARDLVNATVQLW